MNSVLTGASSFIFVPLVLPSEVASFESFAYNYYEQHPDLYGSDPARSEFGRGIYSYGRTNYTDGRFHDTTGRTYWQSDKLYLAPALQVTAPNEPLDVTNEGLMINTRFNDVLCGNAHDRIIDCAAERNSTAETCSMLTGLNTLTMYSDPYPRAYVIQPIFAANGSANQVVGFAAASILFNNLLLSHIPADTNGITYVINVNGEILTYDIIDGVPVFKGLGDLHDHTYNHHQRTVSIAAKLDEVIHCDEMVYDITFYPSKTYLHTYETNLRWVFCFGAVVIIMLVSIFFVWYDWVMVREQSEQQAVLNTKRQFVRFISHEVRTPLNAVSMAGDLLLEQVCIYVVLYCITY